MEEGLPQSGFRPGVFPRQFILKTMLNYGITNSLKKHNNNEAETRCIEEILRSDESDEDDDASYVIEELRRERSHIFPCGRFYKDYDDIFYTNAVPNFSEDEFSLHFRMRRTSFDILVTKLEPHLPISLPNKKKIVLFTVFMLAHGENIRLGSHRFGFPSTTGYRFFKTTVKSIGKLMPDYIKWPSSTERRSIASEFESKCGIPGIVGAIDGCHIPVKQPPGNAIDYYNRKQFHSILLQGTCDDKMRFIDVEIGHPGRVHDARMFMESELGKSLSTVPSSLLSEGEHILGDCAYPNSNYVVTPYKNNGRLTQARILFNIRVCSGRSIIENAFGQLKGKFRRLKYLDMGEMEFVEEVIAASCVLHNFILFHKDNSPPLQPQDIDDNDEPINMHYTEDPTIEEIHSSKRDKLIQTLEGKQPFGKRRRFNL